MDEMLKIAHNGQWALEKSADKKADEARAKAIAEFIARKQAASASSAAAAPRPAPSGPNYPAGMRPAQVSTMNHRAEPGSNVEETKQRIAEIRAMADQQEATSQVKPKKLMTESEAARESEMTRRANSLAGGATTAKRLDTQQARDDAAAAAKKQRTNAWNQTVQFLGSKDQPGYKSMAQNMQTKERISQGLPAKELMPPQEMFEDAKGNRAMRPRQGRFHGEGATTRGKIVMKPIGFENKETGERGFRQVPQVEQHQWAWDHDNKKWNHVRTTYANPTTTQT